MNLERRTVNLTPQASDALTAAAERDRLSKTDVINRAIALYDFVTGHIAAGDDIILRNTDGKQETIHLL